MDFDTLLTFITLCQCKNFTKTGDLLHISQSTVTNRIRNLEEYVGKPLLKRNNKELTITNYGKLFLEYANEIIKTRDSALSNIHFIDKYSNIIKIGSVHWIYDTYVNFGIGKLFETYPDISINTTIAHSHELISMIQSREVDVVFSSYPINLPNISSYPFKKDKVVLVASPAFSQYKDGIYKQDLANLPIIFSDIWEKYLHEISEHSLPVEMIFKFHCNIMSIAKEYCKKSVGICFLPYTLAKDALDSGEFIEIPILDTHENYMQTHFSICDTSRNKKELLNLLALLETSFDNLISS